MFSQKFFTLQDFPLETTIQSWKDNRTQYGIWRLPKFHSFFFGIIDLDAQSSWILECLESWKLDLWFACCNLLQMFVGWLFFMPTTTLVSTSKQMSCPSFLWFIFFGMNWIFNRPFLGLLKLWFFFHNEQTRLMFFFVG